MIDWKRIKHFKEDEWRLDPDKANPLLVKILDTLRAISGSKIRINGCWAESGHSKNSWHYTGNAVDFVFLSKIYYLQQYSYLSLFSELRGIGFYPDWDTPGWHVDLRPEFLRWVRINGNYLYDRNVFIKTIINMDLK